MKQIFIVCQSKGGSGKSFITTLIAHKFENDTNVAFIDMDSSTKTLKNQIAFIDKSRVKEANILNAAGKIERDSFVKFFERFDTVKEDKIFIDMGATESEQLYQFLKFDLPPSELKEYFDEIACELIFIVPVAGNTATVATSTYAKELYELVNPIFVVNVMENMELTDSASSMQIANIVGKNVYIQQYGYTESETERGSRIVNMIKNGESSSTLSSLTKSKIRKLIEPLIF